MKEKKHKKEENEEKEIIVHSLKEFKEKFLPDDEDEDLYFIDDPDELGKEIAERVYEKNKHVLFNAR